MNDRYDPAYGGETYGGDQYEIVGYDTYGQPVYRQIPAQQAPQATYDPYAQQGQQAQQGYGSDPYGTGPQQRVPSYDGYDTGEQPPVPSYDPYGAGARGGASEQAYTPYGRPPQGGPARPRGAEQTARIPQQTGPAEAEESRLHGEGERGGENEQFDFVEEPDGDSEDVIDWLKFTENRTERREEARRRARSRLISLVVVLALVAAGGVGYLWYAGKLPGLSSSGTKAGTGTPLGAQNRDVIVVHLHNTAKGGTSTALLVDNTTTKQGTTVLLPNSLTLTDEDGAVTTLAKSVDDDGSSGTRDQLDTVLGTSIQGTWRLDTPYLQNLVDLVGNIEVDTNTDVPDPAAKDAKKKNTGPLVHRGQGQTLSGKMAVAYATYRAPGEASNAQLERFGQVLHGVLRKVSSDPQAATVTVQTLGQIIEPPLSDKNLGAFLAKLADLAKGGDYRSALLPVQADGTVSAQTSADVVKNILGGTAKSPDQGSAVRVSVQNATGAEDNTEKARVVLLNGGFTFMEAGSGSVARTTSQVTYSDAADKENAGEVAKTLGLPASAVTKGSVASNADVSVVLGQDYRPSAS
ncbi:LCP family protein [Streptomyces sp. V3I7]|uniref:LCP family protein n=1 Tax=Streptomyces sp. V3I7 TaxID=3042278 RepID=UPI0027804629|nr:LCP family protein [Streptomyces sp. V3I7]MDQ0990878.1 anionic cell wall polymer biosynthesis LytR-Cps2A-Psr (LCP) family protein [Streptomyces sp. V3I7]